MIRAVGSPESLTPFGDARPSAADSAIELLAARRRRIILAYLETAGNAATLTELAEAVAFREADSAVLAASDHAGVPSETVRSVRRSLHHRHVPKLAAADAVEYDTATKTVTLRERGAVLLERRDAVRRLPR